MWLQIIGAALALISIIMLTPKFFRSQAKKVKAWPKTAKARDFDSGFRAFAIILQKLWRSKALSLG